VSKIRLKNLKIQHFEKKIPKKMMNQSEYKPSTQVTLLLLLIMFTAIECKLKVTPRHGHKTKIGSIWINVHSKAHIEGTITGIDIVSSTNKATKSGAEYDFETHWPIEQETIGSVVPEKGIPSWLFD
jgi:HKD family nuclease